MSLDKYDDLKWLFTSNDVDLRGNLAGKAFLDVPSIRGSQAAEFMDVKNYDNKPSTARDGEVHEDFVKFIVDSALHVREIDAPTAAAALAFSTFLADAKKITKLLEDEMFPTKPTTLPTALPDPGMSSKIRGVVFTAPPTGKAALDFATAQANLANLNNVATFAAESQDIIKNLQANLEKEYRVAKSGSLAFKTLADNSARKVYDNSFGRWDALSDLAKSKYMTYLQLQKNTGVWDPVTNEAEFAMARSNPSQYRLNYKKDSAGNVLLGKALVGYDTTVFNGVWVNGALTTPASGPIFNDLFQDIYKTGTNGSATLKQNVAKSGNIRFNVKVDDLVRNRLYAISQAKVIDVPAGTPEQYRMLSMLDRNIISRDANGKLMITVDGKTVEYGQEDDYTRKILKASHNCYGTYTNGDDAQCKKFIFECLLSQDENALEKCLADKKLTADFFKVATDDIKNLHPVLALRILQQFGFHKYEEFDDVAGMKLWKVESVKNWLKTVLQPKYPNLSSMINQPGQDHILGYLDLISQYVNANPAILNKQYNGTSDEAMGKLEKKKSEYGKRLQLDWEKPKAKGSFITSDIYRLRGHLQQLRASRNLPFFQANRGLFTPFGRQFTPGVGMLQAGGGSKCEMVIRKLNESGQVSGFQVINSYMNAVLTELENRNKTLNPADRKNIAGNIEKYRQLEYALQQSLCYIDEFNTLSDSLQDYKSEVLTEDNLKKFVNRLTNVNTKIQTTEGQLLDIIAKIQDVMGDEAPKNKIQVNDWI